MEDEGGPVRSPALEEETEYDPDLSYWVDDYDEPVDEEYWLYSDAKASQARGEALDADPESSDEGES
jgi:hypothetical protein